MHRIVLDTNVVFSSLYGGKPRAIMDLWRDGSFVLCLSSAILEEYLEVIARFRNSASQAERLVGALREGRNALLIEPEVALGVVSQDPDDDVFLACAVAARADAIISGDRHLLALGSFQGIPIMDPSSFLETLREQ